MVRQNLGQIEFERVLVEDDSYTGKIAGISDVYEATDFKGNKIEKLRIDIETDNDVVLPQFVSAVVSDAGEHNSKKYSNSKLYDLLKNAGVLDAYDKVSIEIFKEGRGEAESNEMFVAFLRKQLIDRQVKVTTKTVTPEAGEQYSVVNNVLRFIDPSVEELKVA